MAEAVLFSLAADILKSLATAMAKPGGSFAFQKIQLLCCAKDELQSLEGIVRTIQAVLLDAEKQQWHNHGVKLWLGNLKDVLYDLQDLLDDVTTEDLRRKVAPGNKISKGVRIFFSKSNQLAYRLKVVNKIQEVNKKMDRFKKEGELLNLEPHPREETMGFVRGKKTELPAPETKIIGREEDKEKIKQFLFDSSSSKSVSVVAIVGKGGLGKTALARLVYNDEGVKNHFQLKMWACVSDVFDMNSIIKEILESAKKYYQGHGDDEMKNLLKDLENKSADQLPDLLHEILSRKKYLLVLDDLWNEDRFKWSKLKDWLEGGVRGSKILITTRSHFVAKVTDVQPDIHVLDGLSGDMAWNLFKRVAFGDGVESIDPRLEKIGRNIVKKCAGVPLAIGTIGGLLYDKKENEWHRFEACEFPQIREIDEDNEGIMEVLKLSYNHLPSCLKHCFAYCSLFPKDYIYRKNEMICLWVAQGFIEPRNEKDILEEVADNYLSVLLYRSFLDAVVIGDDGEVLTFKMHDLMHDLAQKVAGGECKIVNFNDEGILGGIRHVSFISKFYSQEKVVSVLETSKLRTLLYLNSDGLHREPPFLGCHEFFFGLRHCRALVLRNIDTPLSSFGKLKHLRFLDVSGNRLIKSLPDSITDLVNLQTLDLSYCQSLTTLARDLWKLINLRHLLIDGCESLHMPCGLNNLSLLQTLPMVIVRKMDHRVPGGVGSLDELGGLNRLAGSITLRHLEFLQPVPNKGHLKEKQHLRCLRLEWSKRQEEEESESDVLILWENLRPHPNLNFLYISGCEIRSPPSWLSSIGNLVKLELFECGEWKYLLPMGEFPSLRELTLHNLKALEFVQEISELEQSDITRPFFPSLERMSLLFCRNLRGWWGKRQLVGADQDHWLHDSNSKFPKLLDVYIVFCFQLNSLPLFPRTEDLHLNGASGKLLELHTTAVRNYLSEAGVSTFIPLSKLERLKLWKLPDLEHSTLEMLLPLLTNLKSMSLDQCYILRSLSQGMQYLSSLSSLEIIACEQLDLSSHDDELGTQWRSLWNNCMYIWGLQKLVVLPEGIQHVTTLESLRMSNCGNMMRLPEWIGNLSSLRALTIDNCRGLTRLPDGISRLTSLKELRIVDCPVLEERCRRETGEDWEKIARLPCSLLTGKSGEV